MAGGTTMQILGNREDQSAISAARAKELAQQKALQAQANTVFQNSADNNSATTSNATLATGAATRGSLGSALQSLTNQGATPLPATSPTSYTVTGTNGNPMSDATTRAGAAGNAWGGVVNSARNKLGSYGDLETAQSINNANASNQLGVVSNKARGDANLLPLEVEVASHKGDALSGWGQIVSALGSVASMGAAAGIGAGSGAAVGGTLPAYVGTSQPTMWGTILSSMD